MSGVSVGDDDQVLLILLWLSPTFMMKGNARIELEVSESEEVVVLGPNSWIDHEGPRQVTTVEMTGKG